MPFPGSNCQSPKENEKPDLPVEVQLVSLEANISRLERLVGSLEQRLDWTMGPDQPKGISKDLDIPPSSRLTGRLVQSSINISKLSTRVENLLDNLEI